MSIKVGFWNCRGLLSAAPELNNYQRGDVDLLFLSETLLRAGSRFYIENWDVLARLDFMAATNARKGSRGLMLLRRKGIRAEVRCVGSSVQESYWVFQVGNLRMVHLYAEPKISPETILARIDAALVGWNTGECIIFGDFNLDVNKAYSRVAWNKIAFSLEARGLRLQGLETDFTFSGPQGMSKIDHLFVTGNGLVSDLYVLVDFQGSDHKAIGFTFVISEEPTGGDYRWKQTMRWRLNKLAPMSLEEKEELLERSSSCASSYLARLHGKLAPLEAGASREQLDELWEEFLAEVKHLATRFVGKVMPKMPSRTFFTEELLAVKRSLRGMRKVTNRVTGPRREAHLQRMQELYGEYKDLINARRRELIKEYYRKCSYLPVNDMFKLLKRAEKNIKLLKPFLETPGLGEIKDHYASQYASTDEPGVAAKKYRRAYCSDPVSVFTEEEVERCIRKMPNNKAVGEDDLPIELVKLWLPQLRLGITGLFNLFLVSGLVPSRWKKGLIFPVYKEGKDSRLASS